ncbi:hypothetical protein [Zoogloea sp.]|uniref:hypothetical protein n=1 Tax=Zoogloea sp. TaxID=49181 RepID=UPI001D441B2D|nr:hypothetical protein [Zoogloea sp.]MBK6653809.1 hypothetical protein [Zoogloea sp.]
MNPTRFPPLLSALLAACMLTACSLSPPTPDTPPTPAPPATGRDDASPSPVSRPVPAKPRPPRSEKPATKADKPDAKGPEIIVEEAAPEPPIAGPAWLSQCINRQMEGGVIRCDADRLLAEPSPKVKVYTREPGAAGHTRGGVIQLRGNLPRKYRFFIFP